MEIFLALLEERVNPTGFSSMTQVARIRCGYFVRAPVERRASIDKMGLVSVVDGVTESVQALDRGKSDNVKCKIK